MSYKNIFRVVLLCLFAIFVVQNAEAVEVRFLGWSTIASRALVLIGTFIMGLLAGWLPGYLRGRKSQDREIAE